MTDIQQQILAAVRAELGAHGERVADQIAQSNERVAELDAKIAALPATGTAGELRDEWFDRLHGGRPMIAPAEIPIEEVIEQGRASRGVETIEINGMRVPIMRHLPRDAERIGLDDVRGLRAVRMMRALACSAGSSGRVDFEVAIRTALNWGDRHTAERLEGTRDAMNALNSGDKNEREMAARALGTAVLGSGGALVGPTDAGPLLDFLHPMAVVRALGASVLPMPSGTMSTPYLDTGSTASYVGENSGANESSPTDALLVFTRKILQGVIAISKELARESSYAVDIFLRRHLAARMAAREDLAFIRGDGTAHTPRGMKYWAEQIGAAESATGEAHSFDRTESGAPDVFEITATALKAMRLPIDENVPADRPGWIMKPRTAFGLMSKRGATSEQEVFPEVRGGTFYGAPYRMSTQIPQNLAGDAAGNGTGNKTELYYAHFGSLAIAESMALEVEAYDGGAYKDSSGNIASGITNREVVIAAAQGHDFGALYRGKEVVIVTSIDWGTY